MKRLLLALFLLTFPVNTFAGTVTQATRADTLQLANGKVLDSKGTTIADTLRADSLTVNNFTALGTSNISGFPVLTGSTNNTITTVTGADAIQGEANLTFDGTTLTVTGDVSATDLDGIVGSNTPAAVTATTLNATGGGALTGTWSDLGDVTTINIDGGTIDEVTMGAGTAITSIVATTADINAGTFDGVVGGTTPASASATTITGSGVLSIDDVTETTSGTDGSIHTDGGLGVAKDIYVGDDLLIATGGVVNLDGGDVTVTHSAGKLTYGGDGAVEIDYNNHEQTNVDIDSGAIDGTTVGATTPSTGAFTTLSSDGATSVYPETFTLNGRDTTITGFSANIVKRYSLNDPAVMWDRDEFQAKVSVSSIGTRGDTTAAWPTNFAVVGDATGDSLGIVNTDTGEQWIWFTDGGSGASDLNAIGQAVTQTDVSFKDGILRATANGTSEYAVLAEIDFVKDMIFHWSNSGKARYGGNIGMRNSGSGRVLYTSSPALVNNVAYAVDVVRDPEGGVDEFGRPLHYWMVGTADEVSFYNPVLNVIYDSAASGSPIPITELAISPLGHIAWAQQATRDELALDWNVFADSDADGYWANWNLNGAASGGRDITISDSAVMKGLAYGRGIETGAGPSVIVGSDEGLIISTGFPNLANLPTTSILTYEIDATQNAPPWSGEGTKKRGWALNSVSTVTSTFGSVLTNNNTVTFPADYADFELDNTEYLNIADHADFNEMTALTAGAWINLESVGALAGIMGNLNLDATTSGGWLMWVDASNKFNARISAGGGGSVRTSNVALSANKWYFVALTWETTTGFLKIYVDGVFQDQSTVAGSSIDNNANDLLIGAYKKTSVAAHFDGKIKNAFFLSRVLTTNEMKALIAKEKDAIQQNVIANDVLVGASVQDVETAEDGSIWVLAGASTSADSTLHRLTPTGIPTDTLTASGLVDIDVWSVNGAKPDSSIESYGVAMALGTGGLRLIQPDPVVADVASNVASVKPTPSVFGVMATGVPMMPRMFDAIVDINGGGDFYRIQDAMDLYPEGAIFIRDGEYKESLSVTESVHDKLQLWGESWQTIISGDGSNHTITLTADHAIIANLQLKNYSGETGNADVINYAGSGIVFHCLFTESDGHFIEVNGDCQGGGPVNCVFNGSDYPGPDSYMIHAIQTALAVRDCIFIGDSGSGTQIHSNNSGDRLMVTGCYFGSTDTAVYVNAATYYCLIVGNSSNGAITDAGSGSELSSNVQW